MSHIYNISKIEIKHSRLFIKNLLVFLVPVLLPVLLLGSFSIIITHQYIQNNIDNHNYNLLKQVRIQTEVLFEETEAIYRSISLNPEVNINLKRILKSNKVTMEDYRIIRSVRNLINGQEKARPYIHSIYIYYENVRNQFLTTSRGLIVDDNYFDIKWKEEYFKNKNNKDKWLSYRRLNPYGFNTSAVDVITLYWVLKNNGNIDGVIILNVYAGYIEQMLKKIETLPEQFLIVQSGDGTILFSSKDLNYLDKMDMLYTLKADKKGIIKSRLASRLYDWNYYSIVPEKIIYRIPLEIRKILFVLLLFLIIVGVIVSYLLTRRNYSRIENIINIIHHAEIGKELPDISGEINDEYSYITSKIIKTFIQNNYLKLHFLVRKYRFKTLELLALQSQINPHFLYNTIETVYWMAFQITGEYSEINNALENLSDIIKYSLHNPREKVTIAEEISHTKNYLEIQQIRYEDKFDVIWHYSDDLSSYQIIKLVLQPLVENAIYHGIKEDDGKCTVKVKLRPCNDMIKVSIVDNGVGISREHLKEIRRKLMDLESIDYDKIGIYNTSKRLSLIYGNFSRIRIRSKKGLGTVVYFFIPREI